MTEITIDLPMPPSTNRIWRRARKDGLVKSPEYAEWLRNADAEVMAVRGLAGHVTIRGPFTASIYLNNNMHRGDGDNRIKAALDWAESRLVVENDGHCEAGMWAWVDTALAPLGCRLVIRAMGEEHDSTAVATKRARNDS